MKNLGDFAAKQIVRGSFNSRSTSGAPITLAGTPSLVCYKNNGATEQTGVTLNVDFDSRTGYHIFEIDTDDAFYQKNCDYSVVIAAGTVDSVSVVGVEVGFFSIENRTEEIIRRNAFVATDLEIGTVTSQTVFVLTGGPTNNIANVMAIFYDTSASGAPVVAEGSYVGSTGTLTLTAATPITVTTSDTVTLVAVAATGSVILADGSITAATFGASAITSTVLADGVITDAKVASDVTIASVTGAVGSVTGNVGGNVTGSVGSVLGGINTTAGTITTLDALDTAQDSQHSTTQSDITSLLARLGAFTGSGVNTVLGFFLALMKKDASLPSDVGGTYAVETDSLEANAEALATVKKVGQRVRHTLNAKSGTAGEVGAYDETTETVV